MNGAGLQEKRPCDFLFFWFPPGDSKAAEDLEHLTKNRLLLAFWSAGPAFTNIPQTAAPETPLSKGIFGTFLLEWLFFRAVALGAHI